MGYNATLVVICDALDQIALDKEFGKKVADAVGLMGLDNTKRVDIASGSHANAAHVVESHHADTTAIIAVGGNLGVVQSQTRDWAHHKPEVQERMVRDWAQKLGFDLVKAAPGAAPTPLRAAPAKPK